MWLPYPIVTTNGIAMHEYISLVKNICYFCYMGNPVTADDIRDYLRAKYINPARARHESAIRIVAGDVHREMNLHNRVPAVWQVLAGKKFLAENDLTLEKREGPTSGPSTTAVFVYRLADSSVHSEDDRIRTAWESLRGIGKEVFAALGGGESFLRSERQNFYGSGANPANHSKDKK
jgi:hypothetical protein